MASTGPKRAPALYAFSLPPTVLANLRPRQLHIPESHPLYSNSNNALVLAEQQKQDSLSFQAPAALAIGGAFTCTLTGASFPDLASLRDHYKTDWYKYNVKLRLQGKPTGVTEDEFNALVDGLSASISGSDSDSDADDSSGSSSSSTNAVSRLLQKQRIGQQAPVEAIDELGTLSGPRSAVIWYEAPDVTPGTQYGVYRALLPLAGVAKSRADGATELAELKTLQLPEVKPSEGDKPRQWTLLMFGGGHFAGMVVSLVPKLVSKGKGKEKEREIVVLQKKTFHRYTTRRKQGGAQGSFDSGQGKAKSAGAQIRRHNEAALTDEVQELLTSWTQEINDSELIFLRCSRPNYKSFFDYEGAPMNKKDRRIRGYSFPTKRPTINELLRAFTELTRVKVSHLSAEALASLDAEYLSSITPISTPVVQQTQKLLPSKPVAPKLSRAEELERDRWERMVDMVKKGKIEVLSSFLDKYGPELEQVKGMTSGVWGTLPDWMDESKITPTLLHVASSADQAEMVRWLLVEKRADPTLEASVVVNEAEGEPSSRPILTPYEMAPSRGTRNIFRFLTASNPDWWDWTGTGPTGARVPSGLTEDKEEERDSKNKDRRSKLREKIKERDKERDLKEALEKEALEKEKAEKERVELEELKRKGGNRVVPTGPQRLGGGPPRVLVNREMAAAGLTEEQKMRIQREQRARAAEARLGGGGTPK